MFQGEGELQSHIADSQQSRTPELGQDKSSCNTIRRSQRVAHSAEPILEEKSSLAQLMNYIQYDSARPKYSSRVPRPATFSEVTSRVGR